MNRFRTRRGKAKDEAVMPATPRHSESEPASSPFRMFSSRPKKEEPKPEIDLSNVLPASENFRTSLLMTGLSARFSMLREQDDPLSKIGKASDDSVLYPNRQSKLFNLSDIAEVESILPRDPHDPYARTNSYCSSEYAGSTAQGSVLTRPRPPEGNVLFSGRQKIYKISANGAGKSGMGKVLYDDDVAISAFQQYRRDEKARRLAAKERGDTDSTSYDDGYSDLDAGHANEPLSAISSLSTPQFPSSNSRSPSPISFSSSPQIRDTFASSTFGSSDRSSTAGTSIHSQVMSLQKDFQQSPSSLESAPSSVSSSSTRPSLEKVNSVARTRRLYEASLQKEAQEQQQLHHPQNPFPISPRLDTLGPRFSTRAQGSNTLPIHQYDPRAAAAAAANDQRRLLTKSSAPTLYTPPLSTTTLEAPPLPVLPAIVHDSSTSTSPTPSASPSPSSNTANTKPSVTTLVSPPLSPHVGKGSTISNKESSSSPFSNQITSSMNYTPLTPSASGITADETPVSEKSASPPSLTINHTLPSTQNNTDLDVNQNFPPSPTTAPPPVPTPRQSYGDHLGNVEIPSPLHVSAASSVSPDATANVATSSTTNSKEKTSLQGTLETSGFPQPVENVHPALRETPSTPLRTEPSEPNASTSHFLSPESTFTTTQSSRLSGMVRQHLRGDSNASSYYEASIHSETRPISTVAPTLPNFTPFQPIEETHSGETSPLATPSPQAESAHGQLPNQHQPQSQVQPHSQSQNDENDPFARELAEGARRIRERMTTYADDSRPNSSSSYGVPPPTIADLSSDVSSHRGGFPNDDVLIPPPPRSTLDRLKAKSSLTSLIDRAREAASSKLGLGSNGQSPVTIKTTPYGSLSQQGSPSTSPTGKTSPDFPSNRSSQSSSMLRQGHPQEMRSLRQQPRMDLSRTTSFEYSQSRPASRDDYQQQQQPPYWPRSDARAVSGGQYSAARGAPSSSMVRNRSDSESSRSDQNSVRSPLRVQCDFDDNGASFGHGGMSTATSSYPSSPHATERQPSSMSSTTLGRGIGGVNASAVVPPLPPVNPKRFTRREGVSPISPGGMRVGGTEQGNSRPPAMSSLSRMPSMPGGML